MSLLNPLLSEAQPVVAPVVPEGTFRYTFDTRAARTAPRNDSRVVRLHEPLALPRGVAGAAPAQQ